jgi:cellulose synthase/poly-beta-1,6-N-acetylglucosamine synthase-like glycosyltransferase
VTIILALLFAPLILLTCCFAVEVTFGLRSLALADVPQRDGLSAVIIVPAHDEEAILQQRLSALKAAASQSARVLLVADNCSDSTAAIARSLGIETIERHDLNLRGKGFALDFAKRHLETGPPDVVMIVDADCTIDAESIERLILRCAVSGNPCQATNLQAPAPEASPAVQVSTFAFFIKNVIRQRGLQRLAGRVNLLGTGMALPWEIFAKAELATGNIVEDLKLGQELAEAGHPPLFAEDATVWSRAESEKNTLSQRRRWEGGFLQNALQVGPQLLFQSVVRGDGRGVWAAISLMIPPLALLMLLNIAALLLGSFVAWFLGARPWPLLLLAGGLLLAGLALLLAWRGGGSKYVTVGGLALIPLYMLWKLPLYLGFVRHGAPKEWMRTGRGGQ